MAPRNETINEQIDVIFNALLAIEGLMIPFVYMTNHGDEQDKMEKLLSSLAKATQDLLDLRRPDRKQQG